jgi:predicted Co/Zn/Cd cation transporter (cation efflux family)
MQAVQAILFIFALSNGIYAWVVYGRRMPPPFGALVSLAASAVSPLATVIFVLLHRRRRQQQQLQGSN